MKHYKKEDAAPARSVERNTHTQEEIQLEHLANMNVKDPWASDFVGQQQPFKNIFGPQDEIPSYSQNNNFNQNQHYGSNAQYRSLDTMDTVCGLFSLIFIFYFIFGCHHSVG